MNYYNKIDDTYMNTIASYNRQMYYKIEILDHWENAIGEITKDLSSGNVGTITVNLEQGCRRSCSLSFIDKDLEYLPCGDSVFWYNRKFMIYIGVLVRDNVHIGALGDTDIYWFPQGVFVVKSASVNNHEINVEAVDKFGFLNGELNTRMCMVEYQASVTNSKKGTKIADLIRDTLMLDLGNNRPLDPVEPIIDGTFSNATLYDDIVLSEGQYLGDLFTALCDMYGANCYYDVNGHLRFERVFNYNVANYYYHLSPDYRFNDLNLDSQGLQLQYNYDGVNIVTVTTDNSSGEIYTYTAKNENPASPVNIYDVGYKGNSDGTVYISLGDTTDCESGEERCRQYAEYLLLHNTLMSISVSFNYYIIPHLDVDHTILVSSNETKIDDNLFVIQSLNIPLGIGEMSLEVTNVQWLPSDSSGSATV